MKHIDFSKEVENTASGGRATVLQEGLTLVKMSGPNGNNFYVIDEHGKTYLTATSQFPGSTVRFANVVEETADTLVVYRDTDGLFRIDQGGDRQHRHTRAQAEKIQGEYYTQAILVKVPT